MPMPVSRPIPALVPILVPRSPVFSHFYFGLRCGGASLSGYPELEEYAYQPKQSNASAVVFTRVVSKESAKKRAQAAAAAAKKKKKTATGGAKKTKKAAATKTTRRKRKAAQ